MAMSENDERRLRERLRRTELRWKGTFKLATNGTLTDEGIDQLLNEIDLLDMEIKRKAAA